MATETKKKKRWKPDSSKYSIPYNLSYYAPAIHPGAYFGMELPLMRRYKNREAKRLLVKMGLRDSTTTKTSFDRLIFEPGLGIYNRRFNHMGTYLGANLFYRRTFHSRLFTDFGMELGRIFYLYSDVIEFDERNNPVSRNLASKGYFQTGLNASLGYEFSDRFSLFYRYHIGILFPFNHSLSTYGRNELGFRITRKSQP